MLLYNYSKFAVNSEFVFAKVMHAFNVERIPIIDHFQSMGASTVILRFQYQCDNIFCPAFGIETNRKITHCWNMSLCTYDMWNIVCNVMLTSPLAGNEGWYWPIPYRKRKDISRNPILLFRGKNEILKIRLLTPAVAYTEWVNKNLTLTKMLVTY